MNARNVRASGIRGRASGIRGRASGILLHPSSLPGPHGIGDLGESAYRFLDWLASAGQRLWQVLPLGPTGYGDSPYACFSSFAGNPLLISLEALTAWGIIVPGDFDGMPAFPADRVDYGSVIGWKIPLLRKAAERFLANVPAGLRPRFDAFRAAEGWWLEEYCLFNAVKATCPGAWSSDWPPGIALRDPAALEEARRALAASIDRECVIQFFFFTQWDELRAAAVKRGIRIIGDLPIFAAPDSADVWAHRELFHLDPEGRPTVVSGVPPDYFAATGQLWGNPLYDWDALERDGFRFWVDRIRAACRLFDLIRVDHFRGFESCWAVPVPAETAVNGTWVAVPGQALFETLERELGELPIIAEDLGVITPAVSALRERFGFPGMRILQFAFDKGEAGSLDPGNRFLPHNHTADSVVYTGTHDNDTTPGWFKKRTDDERRYLQRYAGSSDPEIEWRLIRLAMASVCRYAVVPLQDVLGLGSAARMNTPGTTGPFNWSWRAAPDALRSDHAARLRDLAEVYGRTAG